MLQGGDGAVLKRDLAQAILDGLAAGRVAGVKAVAIPQYLVYGPGAPLLIFHFASPGHR